MATVFECEQSKKTLFGFTVKDNRQDVTDYDSFMDRAKRMECDIQEYYPEKDSKGRLHLHGIISIPKGFYRKKLMMSGLHLKLEEIYDIDGWRRYCKKSQPNTDENSEEDELIEIPKKSLFTKM